MFSPSGAFCLLSTSFSDTSCHPVRAGNPMAWFPPPVPSITEDFLVSTQSNPLLHLLLPCPLEGLCLPPPPPAFALPVFCFSLLSPHHFKAPLTLQTCLATAQAAQLCSHCAAHQSRGCSTSLVQLQPAKLPPGALSHHVWDGEALLGSCMTALQSRGWADPAASPSQATAVATSSHFSDTEPAPGFNPTLRPPLQVPCSTYQ